MRQSFLFTKTRREAPADEVAKNAQLLLRAGYISKEMAGAYSFLPLGLRVMEKIKQIIREEMNAVSGQELIMSTLQRKELWESTGRWADDAVDVWFKSELKAGGEVGLGWSHEEPIGEMMKTYINSYKDMPISVYQFQTKLRNELRAKSGIMRGREFVMKDMYSFCADEKSHLDYYESTKPAYQKIFERLGIGDDTFVTFAAGGAFTKFSHEFQTICEAGEDIIYLNKEKGIAINEEILNEETLDKLGVKEEDLTPTRSAEVGNIFNFGQQKAEDLGLRYKNDQGEDNLVWMGSYGIGVTRLLGVLIEKMSDEKGIVLPACVAPFQVHLIALNTEDEEVRDWADGVYTNLTSRGLEVLYDDRELRPGEKFSDSELIGIPYRVVVSKKGKAEGTFEVVTRESGDEQRMTEEELYKYFIHE